MDSSSSLFVIYLFIFIIASSSSPFPNPQPKYDVFLSLRGQDTGNNFASHLHAALGREKIETIIDDQLVRGEETSQTLLKTIDESKISVIIFSKDYASSSWCLDGLVQILERNRKYGHTIIPIFYHVEPADVRSQSGCFAEAFAKHEEHFKNRIDKVQRWRAALKHVANLAGWHYSQGPESILVDKIVSDILRKLNYRSSSVGKDERIPSKHWILSPLNDIWSTMFFFFFLNFKRPEPPVVSSSNQKQKSPSPSCLLGKMLGGPHQSPFFAH